MYANPFIVSDDNSNPPKVCLQSLNDIFLQIIKIPCVYLFLHFYVLIFNLSERGTENPFAGFLFKSVYYSGPWPGQGQELRTQSKCPRSLSSGTQELEPSPFAF